MCLLATFLKEITIYYICLFPISPNMTVIAFNFATFTKTHGRTHSWMFLSKSSLDERRGWNPWLFSRQEILFFYIVVLKILKICERSAFGTTFSPNIIVTVGFVIFQKRSISNEVKCKTFLVKISFICKRIKESF